jgi:hypothetical protein
MLFPPLHHSLLLHLSVIRQFCLVHVGKPMYTAAQVAQMQQILITSVSCGNEKLEKILADQANTIWCMSSLGCTQELQYLRAQLGMIELAQGYTRNMIDTSSRKASSRAKDKFDSTNYRDNQSQRTGQGTSCAWSKATTFQQFQRDSEQHARSQSDSHADTIGKSSSYLWDRGQTVATGWANSYDQSSSKSEDGSLSLSGACIDRESQSQGGTPAGPVFLDSDGAVQPIFQPLEYGSWSIVNIISSWWQGSWWSGTDVAAPQGGTIWGSTNAPYAIGFPTSVAPNCPTEESPDCPQIPSYGGSYTDSWNLSVGIPAVGSVSSTWSEGQDARQSYTCHTGSSNITGSQFENSNSRGIALAESEGKTESHDEGESVHDRHSSASAFRDSESRATANATDTMRSHGETHNGSDNSAHGESQAGNQMTAYGTSHSEGHGTAFSHSESDANNNYWSQIFGSLADMWQRVWDEIKELERVLSLATGIKIGAMKSQCTPCEVKNRGMIRKQGYPALLMPQSNAMFAMAKMGGCKH